MKQEDLGHFVSQRRKNLELRQSDLGETLGYTAQAISVFEAGQSKISVTVLPELANLLKLSLDDLLNRNVPATPFTGKNDPINAKLVAHNLVALRTKKGLSLAEEGNVLGVSKRTIINYEQGNSLPTLDVVDALLEYYDLTPSAFFYQSIELPLTSPVFSRKRVAFRKGLIGFMIAFLVLGVGTAIAVPLIINANQPKTDSHIGSLESDSGTSSSSSSEASDISSDFPGLKGFEAVLDDSSLEKEAAPGDHTIALLPTPSNYFDDSKYTVNFAFKGSFSDVALSGTDKLGRTLSITATEFNHGAARGFTVTVTNTLTSATYSKLHRFTIYNPTTTTFKQTNFPGVRCILPYCNGSQFVDVHLGDTFTMKVDIRMEEGKTYDPSLYTITPTFSSALTCVSSKFQNTLQMEVTFRVDKANTSTFNWAASFDLNNQAGESLSGTSLVVSYLTD
jgi:transcriptional regulator with XRE-family HTH domain